MKKIKIGILGFICSILTASFAFATPTTLIWTPSTDIQTYKKIHLNIDEYFPTEKRDHTGARVYVLQVYGPTFSLLSEKPEDNLVRLYFLLFLSLPKVQEF